MTGYRGQVTGGIGGEAAGEESGVGNAALWRLVFGRCPASRRPQVTRWCQAQPSRYGLKDVIVGQKALLARKWDGVITQGLKFLRCDILPDGIAHQITDRQVVLPGQPLKVSPQRLRNAYG